MGWQDAPVVDDDAPAAAPSATSSTPAWMSAPEVATPADTTDQVSRRAQQDARAAETNQDQTDRGVANGRLAPSFTDQLAEPWHGETMGSLFKQNAFIRLGTYLQRKAELSTELEGKLDDDPKAPTDRLQRQTYLNDQVDAEYKKRYAKEQTPDIEWSKLPKQVVKAVTDNPAGFVSQLVKGFVVDPEMLFNPELGAARAVTGVGKAAQVARSAARSAEVGATMGAQSAGISAAQQLEETGDVSGTKVAQEGATGAAMGVTLMGGIEAAKVAADVGIRAVAARKGATVSKEVKAEIDTAIDTAVASGTSPTDALIATLKKHGMAEGEAEHMAAAIEPTQKPKEASNATDTEGQEGQAGNDQGVRSEEGDAGVLRDGEQGQGEGAGQEAQGQVAPKARTLDGIKALAKDHGILMEEADSGFHASDGSVAYIPSANADPALLHGANREQVAAHELGHALLQKWGMNGDIKGPPFAELRKQLRDVSRELFPSKWAAHPDHMAKSGELMADGIAAWLQHPELRPRLSELDRWLGGRLGDLDRPRAPGDLPPLEFTKEPAPPQSKEAPVARAPDDGTWFHYTREPGVRELDPAKSNPGNARGPGVYLSKDASYSGSHKAPRKDKQGNLAAESQPGELLTTKLEPTREARLFDEGTMLSPDEARGLLSDAGMENTEIGQVLGRMKAVSGKRVNAALNKFFGGEWRHSNAFLKEKGYTGVKFADAQGRQLASVWDKTKAEPPGDWGKQAGRIDPKMLAALGLASIGGMGVYALTGDKSKAIGVAAAMGLLPFAKGIVSRLGKGVAAIDRAIGTDRRFDTKQVFRDYYRNPGAELRGRRVEARHGGDAERGARHQGLLRAYPRLHARAPRHARSTPQEAGRGGRAAQVPRPHGASAAGRRRAACADRELSAGPVPEEAVPIVARHSRRHRARGWFRGNYTGMSPTSKHALQKVIPDYRTVDALIKAGQARPGAAHRQPVRDGGAVRQGAQQDDRQQEAHRDAARHTPGRDAPTTRATWCRCRSSCPSPPVTRRRASRRATRFERSRCSRTILAEQDKMRDLEPLRHHERAAATTCRSSTRARGPARAQGHRRAAEAAVRHVRPGRDARALYALSMAAKSALFSFSLFHAGALATVAGTMALTRPRCGARLPEARGDGHGHAVPPEVAHWLEHGLTLFHHVQDVDPSFFQRAAQPRREVRRGVARSTPACRPWPRSRASGSRTRRSTTFMWARCTRRSSSQPRWPRRSAGWRRTRPATDGQGGARDRHRRERPVRRHQLVRAGQQRAGRCRAHVATALFAAGAPLAADHAALPRLAARVGARLERGRQGAMPGLDAKASDSLYRSYLLMSGLTYLGLAQMLQQHYTKENIWEKDDWTYVDMGDGRRIQLNKHFMEVPHLISDPVKFMLNKLNYMPKETLAQVFSKEYLTHKANAKGGDDFYGPPMKDRSATGRVVHAAKALVSPITVQNLFEDPAKAVSGFFGIPVYGSTFEQQAARKAEAKAKRSAAKSKG
jgi:hypothetical protein